MVPTLFFCEIVLVALVWLFLMLSWLWANDPATRYPTRPQPRPPHKRFNEPKPFAGLTQRPHYALCEQDVMPPQALPPAPPDPLPPTHRRPRTVDTSRHFCPHADCDYRGWRGLGNLRANGHPSGGPWRQLHCTACDGYLLETHRTLFHGKRVTPDLLVWAVGALAEGLGIRAVARVFEVDPNTVLLWLVEAADHLKTFSQYFLHNVRVTQIQLDELYVLLSVVKDDEVSAAEALKRLSRSPHWVWVAIDPVTKLLLAIDVGARTLAMAQCFVHQVAQVLAPTCVPLFLTDGYKPTVSPLLTPVASRNLLLYQSLPTRIRYRQAKVRRRKDDPGVGTATRRITEGLHSFSRRVQPHGGPSGRVCRALSTGS
jgi:hypothetical protein